MRLVIIESPYAGRTNLRQPWRFLFGWAVVRLKRWRNVLYARALVREAVIAGAAPIASHLLLTQPGILRDDVPEERARGIAAGLAWADPSRYASPADAPIQIFGTDLGWSTGMLAAEEQARKAGRPYLPWTLKEWARLPRWMRR